MATNTHIEWTDKTWNPVTGCTKLSQGCKHCYAERMAKRLKAMGQNRYHNGFAVTLQEDLLELPLTWKKPSRVFVNSMSDLFHVEVPLSYVKQVFAVMERCPQHTFQILTKRSERLHALAGELPWPPNVWMGVSVEDKEAIYRIYHLQTVPASVRFLSIEPLIGPLPDLPLQNIDWVIVGGESGPKARPMQKEWVESIQKQCHIVGVPFFFKQWGGTRKDLTGRELNGQIYDNMPSLALMPG